MIKNYIYRVITLCLLLLAFTGCRNNPIDLIKGGILNSYPSVTIGDALEVSFSDGKWETFETDKKVLVVEFTGKVSKKLSRQIELGMIILDKHYQRKLLSNAGISSLQDLVSKKAIIQFIIHKDGKNFELSFFKIENTLYKYEDLVEYIFN